MFLEWAIHLQELGTGQCPVVQGKLQFALEMGKERELGLGWQPRFLLARTLHPERLFISREFCLVICN